MFNPKEDRIDYSNLLTPPDGYELDFAVGTTYSLDFNAFISVCMSLGLSEDTDSELLRNDIFLLELLRKTSDKIALFCEGGQIRVPSKATSLYVLLEKSINQVAVSTEKNELRSFHPKFWLISYINKSGEKFYRIIVLSRNLTFDRSWDIVYSMDGREVSETQSKNKPVKDFLAYLKERLPHDKTTKCKKLQELIDSLDKVKFSIDDKTFEDFDFIPLGIGNYYINDYPLFNSEKYYELMVMSPFLTASTIESLNDRWRTSTVRPVLITRRASLNQLLAGSDNYKISDCKNCNNFEVYCMKSEVVNGEEKLEEGDYKEQDIHAKVYLMSKNSWQGSELYLGSMNSSYNAMHGNVEFMIRLIGKRKYLNLGAIKRQLFCGDNESESPFEKVEDVIEIDEQSQDGEDLDRIIKKICRCNMSARVEQTGDIYSIVLDVDSKALDARVKISPFLTAQDQSLEKSQLVFKNLSLAELSHFYKITVTAEDGNSVSRIIVIDTTGIPSQRDDVVITSIIHDESSFFAYLMFALSDVYAYGALEANRVLANRGSTSDGSAYTATLYEKMLKTVSVNPKKLEDIQYIIQAVSKSKKDIISDKFVKLYNTFQNAIKKGKRR